MEESFLQRNYGKDYGELYKPDSMSMGGGRGNGEKFDIDEFLKKSESENTDTTDNIQNGNNNNAFPQMPGGTTSDDTGSVNQMPGGNMQNGQMPNNGQGAPPQDIPNIDNNGQNGDFGGQIPDDNGQMKPQGRNTITPSLWIMIGVSLFVLAFGLVFAFMYKRRK